MDSFFTHAVVVALWSVLKMDGYVKTPPTEIIPNSCVLLSINLLRNKKTVQTRKYRRYCAWTDSSIKQYKAIGDDFFVATIEDTEVKSWALATCNSV